MKNTLKISAFLAALVGLILVIGGIWAACFTYINVTREHIVTPEDSALPGRKLKGPFSIKAQADIIREHTLKITDGKTYAEMPRQVPKLDEVGNSIVDKDGKPVMVPNTARDIWITATALTTALNLAIVTYAFSGFIILFGFISIWNGIVLYILSGKIKMNN